MKKVFLIFLSFFVLVSICTGSENISPEDAFKKCFPKQKFESINPTPFKGIYEVYTGNQIYYFLPEAEVIITGNMITKDGINLTRESNLKKMAFKMAELPLENALKIGKGETTVLEFTDPNCPYCRKAALFFSQRKDVTLYVFLIPLSQDSERKIKHIFCSADKIKTYYDVMTGKCDNKTNLNICNDAKADETMKIHMELARQAGIKATPSFFLKNNVVSGFEQNIIENLLNK